VKEPTVGGSSTGPVSRLRPWHREGRRHWVLARRSVSRPEEISYYIAYCPADATLDELIRIAGSRWAVEECFQTEAGVRPGRLPGPPLRRPAGCAT
jgi:hypothetical protein